MEVTPVTDKHCFANKEKAKAHRAKYRAANPDAVKASRAKYYAANREKIAARNAAWRQANSEKIAAKNAAWYQANREKAVKYDVAYKAAWYQANRPAVNARDQAREALKLQAIPGWADKAEITLIYAKAREWSAILGIELHVDHAVPLRSKLVCGLHTHANLQLLEKLDNIRKGNRYWPDMPGEI